MVALAAREMLGGGGGADQFLAQRNRENHWTRVEEDF